MCVCVYIYTHTYIYIYIYREREREREREILCNMIKLVFRMAVTIQNGCRKLPRC